VGRDLPGQRPPRLLEGTRVEYGRQLRFGAYAFFGERLKLTDVTPLHLADFVRWLADPAQQGGRRYSDSSIANRVNSVRSALATAKRDGLIRHNPADGLALPNRQRIEEDDENTTKALSRDQLRQLLEIAPDDYKLLIETMASTGLRISEAIALQRRDLQLDDELHPTPARPPRDRPWPPQGPALATPRGEAARPYGRGARPHRHRLGLRLPDRHPARRRQPPLPAHQAAHAPDRRTVGGMAHPPPHLRVTPTRSGASVVQLSRALGHHAASFTLDTYIHLLDGESLAAMDLQMEVCRDLASQS
jgi:integrase